MADNTSFLNYMVGQQGKQGRGLASLDKAAGVDKRTNDSKAPAFPASPDQSAAAPAAQPQVAPAAAGNPPMTLNGPDVTETQPHPLMLGNSDMLYRQLGRMPTAVDLASQAFTSDFRVRMGRAPTKEETVAHIYRRPELLQQPASDFNTE